MAKPAYATVEQVAAALDVKATAYETDRLQRLTQAASRLIDRQRHRWFYPLTDAFTYRTVDRPHSEGAYGDGIYLNRDLLSLTSATEDGTAVTVANVRLWGDEVPYRWAQLQGSTIVITGVWGYSQDTAAAGALDGALSDTTGTSVKVTNSSLVGIGDMLIVDSERLIVEAKTIVDTTITNDAALTAVSSDVALTVSGAGVLLGEKILIDSEWMLVREVVSTTALNVERAVDGSVLAAHAGSNEVIYAPRTLTVERGATGSTAATHSDAAAVTRNLPPAAITNHCVAEAINTFEQETSGYARVVGSGETARNATGAGLEDAREESRSYTRNRMARV